MIQSCGSGSGTQKLQFQTEYQAIFLTSGQVYFGKAELGTDYVTLKDVYYVQSQANQKTKEVTNTLIKRGKEPHGPDIMLISKNDVSFIESVTAESQVAKLIKEQKAATAKQ
jgi:hypothetical protein